MERLGSIFNNKCAKHKQIDDGEMQMAPKNSISPII